MKICVIGYSGSGKSTFSQKLKMIYDIPLIHIDAIFFEENWQVRNETIVQTELANFIHQENWIIDGNYSRFVIERFDLAKTIYIFDFNRIKCFYCAILRRIKYHRKQRDSVANGCNEKLDFEFMFWLLYKGRKKNKKWFKTIQQMHPNKIVVFKRRAQVNRHLNELKQK
jgi:adenylate kinase family enzyme